MTVIVATVADIMITVTGDPIIAIMIVPIIDGPIIHPIRRIPIIGRTIHRTPTTGRTIHRTPTVDRTIRPIHRTTMIDRIIHRVTTVGPIIPPVTTADPIHPAIMMADPVIMDPTMVDPVITVVTVDTGTVDTVGPIHTGRTIPMPAIRTTATVTATTVSRVAFTRLDACRSEPRLLTMAAVGYGLSQLSAIDGKADAAGRSLAVNTPAVGISPRWRIIA